MQDAVLKIAPVQQPAVRRDAVADHDVRVAQLPRKGQLA